MYKQYLSCRAVVADN